MLSKNPYYKPRLIKKTVNPYYIGKVHEYLSSETNQVVKEQVDFLSINEEQSTKTTKD